MRIKHFLLTLLLLVIFTSAESQVKTDINQPYPVDEKVLLGQLPNGLTYYIRHNDEPKNRAQFWLVVNVGAIQEEPDQNGLAHFVEHMCFNGTKNFEQDQIIRYLQSIGMKFGPEINAFTGHDVTNYMLQNVPLANQANVDTALMILYEWACNVAFEDEEVDKERGVIHEEWRTGMGSQRRMRNAYFQTLFEGSKYATHDVIGDMDVVLNFEYETLRRFYNDWYRPDLQAIIAIGDFDIREMQKQIVEMFSQIPKAEEPRPRLTETIPDHEETKVSIVTDPEARMVQLMIFHKHPAIVDKATTEYSRNKIKSALYNSMLNNRLSELVQQAEPPFVMAMSSYMSNYVKSADVYVSAAFLSDPDPSDALTALVQENIRVLKHGFTPGEFDRAKREYMANAEKRYNERNNRTSESLAWKYFSHYVNDEPIPGIEFEYQLAQEFIPGISLEEVNSLAEEWLTEDNRVVVITAPEAYAESLPNEETVLKILLEAEEAEIEALEDDDIDRPLHDLELKPGLVEKESFDEDFEYYEWILSNGATVVIKPTTFKEDEILFSAYSKGGSSLYEDDDLITLSFTASTIDRSGIGEFNNIELTRMLSDKVVRISPYIRSLSEGFSGSSTQRDFITLLELLNLYFMSPRADEDAFRSLMNRQRAMIINKANDPASAFSDTLSLTLFDYHPRRQPLDADMLDDADFTKMERVFKERFSNAADWIFYFVGNIDIETAKPLIEKYIGSIPGDKEKTEKWIDRKEYVAEGDIRKRIYTPMQVPKATVGIIKSGKFNYEPKERMLLSFINDILNVRYIQTVREEEGGTYGVSVRTTLNKYPIPTYRFMAYFTCAPERVDELVAIIYQQIDLLKKEGPKQTELRNVVENKLKERDEDITENRFWLRGLRNLYEYGQNTLDTDAYKELVRSITLEDIQNAAKKYYDGSNVIEVIQLPKE